MKSTPSTSPNNPYRPQAYIEILSDHSQLSKYRSLQSSSTHVPTTLASIKLKENTHLRPSNIIMTQHFLSSTSIKRKLANHDTSSSMTDFMMPPSKRMKFVVTDGTPLKAKQPEASGSSTPTTAASSNACPGYPNGFIYCHQCSKKRDLTDTIHCTFMESLETSNGRPAKERRCISKFCRPCLKNRYGIELDDLKSQEANKKKEPGHVNGVGYTFKCPKCKDICNCPRCRKSKGLEPMGNLMVAAKKAAAVAAISNGKVEKKHRTKTKNVTARENIAPSSKIKRTNVKKPQPKPLPLVSWTRIPVNLTLVEVEERIYIREFLLRFSAIMDPSISNSNLEELEEVCGKRRARDDDDQPVSWVSEACVKAIIMGLLGVLGKEYIEENAGKKIKSAIKDMRGLGINLNKIWGCLAALRSAMKNNIPNTNGVLLDFPDPSPPPISMMSQISRNTRGTKTAFGQENTVNVICTVQMIPVIVSLVDIVNETEVVREAIEGGLKDVKDVIRDIKVGAKKENDRWEQIKKGVESSTKDKSLANENKAKREIHKNQLLNFDNVLRILSPMFTPRYQPLGKDAEGRVYYVLSPGVGERDAALDFVINSANGGKKGKKRVVNEDSRKEMRLWSWFVAVWGKRPFSAQTALPNSNGSMKMLVDGEGSDSGHSSDEDVERWWGFSEPEEILKLAEWMKVKYCLDDVEEDIPTHLTSKKQIVIPVMQVPEKPSKDLLRSLVTELVDFASLLEWRIQEDKYELLA